MTVYLSNVILETVFAPLIKHTRQIVFLFCEVSTISANYLCFYFARYLPSRIYPAYAVSIITDKHATLN